MRVKIAYERCSETYIQKEFFVGLIELLGIPVCIQVISRRYMLSIFCALLSATSDSLGTEKSP